MIIECKVETYAEKNICDECKEGEMINDGETMWLSNPPKFSHKCNKCGHKQMFTDKYPTVKFRIKE